MVHHPLAYAELLKKKIQKHGANVWLVNTGWTGGPFGVGKRISIHHTRALLNAALSGSLLKVEYKKDPIFGFDVPIECEGVPSQILDPANTWPSRDEYFAQVRRAGRALHRELQADDGRVSRAHPRGRAKTIGSSSGSITRFASYLPRIGLRLSTPRAFAA